MTEQDQHELKQLRNIAQRLVNFSDHLEQGKVEIEYQYAMILSRLQKDARDVLQIGERKEGRI